ncbi:hypothetical protein V1292_005177 [Bradyrhizobium sp. AZCC 1719]
MATGFRAGGARTGLPNNRAYPLIALSSRPEGDLRVGRQVGAGSVREQQRLNKKKHKTAGQKQWRQTAHKIYKTPS